MKISLKKYELQKYLRKKLKAHNKNDCKKNLKQKK